MQKRFWLSTHRDFEKAAREKHNLQEKNTDRKYQIRRGREGSNIVFRVVERLASNEANIINERKNPVGWKKRPSKRQRRERAISEIL